MEKSTVIKIDGVSIDHEDGEMTSGKYSFVVLDTNYADHLELITKLGNKRIIIKDTNGKLSLEIQERMN